MARPADPLKIRDDDARSFEQLVADGEVDFAILFSESLDADTARLVKQAFDAGRKQGRDEFISALRELSGLEDVGVDLRALRKVPGSRERG